MEEEKFKRLLGGLAERTEEAVSSDLGEQIKQQIPRRLERHKIGWDSINIIIDLRLSKSAAAAVIILALILFVNLFGGRDAGAGMLRDSLLLIKYWGAAGQNDVSAIRSKYEYLLERGKDATWYGDGIDLNDRNAVLMQYKLPNGRYVVTFADGHEREVSAEVLIKLLTGMLQSETK